MTGLHQQPAKHANLSCAPFRPCLTKWKTHEPQTSQPQSVERAQSASFRCLRARAHTYMANQSHQLGWTLGRPIVACPIGLAPANRHHAGRKINIIRASCTNIRHSSAFARENLRVYRWQHRGSLKCHTTKQVLSTPSYVCVRVPFNDRLPFLR